LNFTTNGVWVKGRAVRTFVRALLSADRSAGDSFTNRAARAAADMLRIAYGPKTVQCGFSLAINLDRPRIDCNVCLCSARSVVSRILVEIEAELAAVRPAEKTHLRQRAELVRSLFALS
jgi:hypothetical protein